MAATLLAVVFALVIGHLVPQIAAWRRYDLFFAWLRRLGGGGAREPALPIAIAVLVPMVLTLIVQSLLEDYGYGLPGFIFALAVVLYVWGPRDLDRDVDAVLTATDRAERQRAAQQLFDTQQPVPLDGATLIGATAIGAMERWFGVLLWFLLLGPAGAVLYRTAHLTASEAAMDVLTADEHAAARRLRAILDWPVAHLMALGLALVGSFDAVLAAWRRWHTASGYGWWTLDLGFLPAVAQASVDSELIAEEEIAADAAPPPLLELRDAMSQIWRLLILWLAVVALCVLAGYVG